MTTRRQYSYALLVGIWTGCLTAAMYWSLT